MSIFNAKSENHHPYAAKRLFVFRRHRARGLGNGSKRSLGVKFGLKFRSGSVNVNGLCGVDVAVNGLCRVSI